MEPRAFLDQLKQQTEALHGQGLYKRERIITSPQKADIRVQGGREVLNFCANNYLGLSDHPALVKAAQEALPAYGFGMSSVRFICGTQT
ncbi:MAG TPA: glycine C-acetyltransferase, partial [Myxococcales bacterium]|nr:glycine C-acetyltransferase [Myxococcales bacterium]